MRIVPGGTARPDRVQSPAVLTRFTQLSTIVCIHRGGTTPHLDAALTGDAFFQDPYPVYAALREDSPVHWCEPWAQWVVTCWDDVRDVLLDSDRFSSAGYEAGFVENLETRLGLQLPALRHHFSTEVLSLTDPPVHTRLRRALAGSFTPRVVRSIEPLVNELVRARLDDLRGSARFDVIADLAYPIPAIVIAQLLGVPEHDRDRFCTWSAAIIGFTGGGAPDAERATRAEAAMAEFQSYLADRIARTRAAPGDDLLSLLVTAEPGDRLNDRELVATCITVLFAGHETTANLIGNAVVTLLRHPAELARLRADPTLVSVAVEETLRYESPVQRNRRIARVDLELGSRQIRRGDSVLAFLGSANRDPTQIADPDQFDLTRTTVPHMAFGHGIHFCLGAALSRLEAPIVLAGLLAHYPDLRLADEPARFRQNIVFRGLDALIVETPAPG